MRGIVLDVLGVWEFQLDPREEGASKGWFEALPAPRPIAVAGQLLPIVLVPLCA